MSTRAALRLATSGLAVTLLAGSTALMAPPAAAADQQWVFDQRPADHPTTDVPARRFERVDAVRRYGDTAASTYWLAQVVLEDVPTADTDAVLRVTFGTLGDGGCRATEEVRTSTFAPSAGATREGATLVLQHPIDYAAPGVDCASATLAAADERGTAFDRLDGTSTGGAVGDPVGEVRIEWVADKRVVPGRWTTVRVRVRNVASPVDGIRLTGAGNGVTVEAVTIRRAMATDEAVTLPLRVKLSAPHGRAVIIRAIPRGSLMDRFDAVRRVWLRPR